MHSGMTDAAIATRCSNHLKFAAASAAQSACECAHPQLRHMFQQAAHEAIQAQGQLTELMLQRGWYVPLMATAQNAGQFQQNLAQVARESMNVVGAGGTAPSPGMGTGFGAGAGYQAPRF